MDTQELEYLIGLCDIMLMDEEDPFGTPQQRHARKGAPPVTKPL